MMCEYVLVEVFCDCCVVFGEDGGGGFYMGYLVSGDVGYVCFLLNMYK